MELLGRRSLSVEAENFTAPGGVRSGEGKSDYWRSYAGEGAGEAGLEISRRGK